MQVASGTLYEWHASSVVLLSFSVLLSYSFRDTLCGRMVQNNYFGFTHGGTQYGATSAAAYQTGQAGYAITPAATVATNIQRPAAAAATGYETYQAEAAAAATGTTCSAGNLGIVNQNQAAEVKPTCLNEEEELCNAMQQMHDEYLCWREDEEEQLRVQYEYARASKERREKELEKELRSQQIHDEYLRRRDEIWNMEKRAWISCGLTRDGREIYRFSPVKK